MEGQREGAYQGVAPTERDEGEREEPYETYPWDGVSGVRPFQKLAATTTVGVY